MVDGLLDRKFDPVSTKPPIPPQPSLEGEGVSAAFRLKLARRVINRIPRLRIMHLDVFARHYCAFP